MPRCAPRSFELQGRKIQYFLASIGAVFALVIIPATWYIQAIGGEGASRSVRLDYRAFYGLLKKDGPVATIVGDRQWIGNFRLAAPDLVLLEPEVPYFRQLITLPAAVVWLGDKPLRPVLAKRLEKAGYALDGDVKKLTVRSFLARRAAAR